jgi:very-short-patch-repair endonuclease
MLDRDSGHTTNGASEVPPSVKIDSDIATSFTFASYQNAIPVLRSLAIENPTDRHLEQCRLAMVATPGFLRPKLWTVDRLAPGDRIVISDRWIELDAGYLAGLDEAERGEITLRLYAKDECLAESRVPVRLLARDEWGGVADMAQLLPAFVLPNDPAVAKILRAAADSLAGHGHPSGLDGYQSNDPKRSLLLAAAVYSAIAGLKLHYAEPPASFEQRGQKVRRPSTVAQDRLATCLDTSLLFAAALEGCGLNSALLLFQNHAAVGVWLTKRTFPNAVEADLTEVRKAVAAREFVAFETTGVTHRPPVTLDHARQLVAPRFEETQAAGFVAAIDLHRSRSSGITPLASHAPAQAADSEAGEIDLPITIDTGPIDLPAEVVELKPTTAAGRIDRWQKKLLDLTLRNRLLNFPDSKKTIPFLCTDVAYLEDRLAEGAAMRLISLPEHNPLGERDPALYREVRGQDLNRTFAADALGRGELASPLDAKSLEARLIELHRLVRNDFAEGGANTLFLAVGFLRWKRKPNDERSYRAPLLLLPVKLDRRSASSQFSLRFHEDEPRFNATLLQFLEREFDLPLPQFAGELPQDENGIDVPRLLGAMRQAVRDVPGMEVVDDAALSTFSFAKHLMWKDLVERTDALRENRLVRHLIDSPDQPFPGAADDFVDERQLDRRYDPADVVSVLPADSSQVAASVAAAEGRDFVIIGPPGTGKSQTIANMIANCLASGKTVLFVAEKTAALNVVHRRLKAHGLGDHCLELHSNKADRKSFLAQLRKSWEKGHAASQSDWIAVNRRLKLKRDVLNAYVDALHKRHPNGLTPYIALGTALRSREHYAPVLSWPHCDVHDDQARRALGDLADEIGRVFAAVERVPVLACVNTPEWSSAWQEQLLTQARELAGTISTLRKSLAALLPHLGLPTRSDASAEELERFSVLAGSLCESAGTDQRIAFDPDFGRLKEALAELEGSISSYRAAEAELSATFARDSVLRVPVDDLERDWREARAAMWPRSWLASRRVKKLLQSYATAGQPDPDKDLPILRRLQGLHASVGKSGLAGKPLRFAGLDTDVAAVERHLTGATKLRDSLLRLGQAADDIRAIVKTIARILVSGSDAEPIRHAATDYREAYESFSTALEGFSALAGSSPARSESATVLSELLSLADHLASARHLLRNWASWCRIRALGEAQGLSALIKDLESEVLSPHQTREAFDLAYARWWLPVALDSDATLRDFRRFQHEHAIEEFREIDDLVRAKATSRVVSALAHGLPSVQNVPRNSELGLLRHQMELQRPSRSIREMIGAMPGNFGKLAPCMLMSPLSIAQYFPPNQALFDVVIFDEASQITTWDAVGAIARGRQTIIVGDPRQLPPTNFFGRNEDDEEVEDYERDLESILDETKAAGIPVRDLRWHYRSRNESLIAFSNAHYYQNRLITFPAPTIEDRSVRLVRVEGVYDRGKTRTNRTEARRLVDDAIGRMRAWLAVPDTSRPTLGIITFNAQQQALIQDFLDETRRLEPALEWFFAEDRIEPTIVKNLENVQGDERDVILFSITFSKDAAGKRTMDFGALNRDGGERRLNVAVTRARQELVVYSGFAADDIDTGRTKAIGVQHLKTFLDFAERGPIALPARDEGSVGGLESPFEEAVAEQLARLGWQLVPQVGISGFRVDIGVKHPDRAGAYLAGVECDGATYHSSATARDRDKVREQVLRGLGWNIVRVWSTDWWFDPNGAMQRLHEALKALLADSRARAAEETADQPLHWELGEEVEAGQLDQDAAESEEAPEDAVRDGREQSPQDDVLAAAPIADVITSPVAGAVRVASRTEGEVGASPSHGGAQYRLADLSQFRADPDQFFEFGYRATLHGMVDAVMEAEAPLRADVLAQRIARAHGWLRTGARIRERIDLHLRDLPRTEESSGPFLWRPGTIEPIYPYRAPVDVAARRAIQDTPLAELASIAVSEPALLEEIDPALALARLLGVERLAATSRARLDEALQRAATHLAAAPSDGE